MMIEYHLEPSRSPVMGCGGMAATSQPLAVSAGLEILRQGGNAADAAVAIAAALNVTEPTSTGIGGDCFGLFYNAQTGQVSALNGSGRAPAALSLASLKTNKTKKLPPYHAHTVTVPGACAGWCDMVQEYGRLSMSQVLTPAIRLAEEGFPVAPKTAYAWKRGVEKQLAKALNGHEMTINGRAPQAGEIFRNPGLVKTFRLVAERGKQAFYQGPVAEAIVAVLQEAGGVMSLDDLANHTSTWEKPISTSYRGFRVWECPPNGQGLAALLALNILEGFELKEFPPLSVQRLHVQIEAMRLAFADAHWFIADPVTNPAPLAELLSKEYAETRRKLINLKKATVNQVHGAPVVSSDTVYLSVVDGAGNACSFINSNYMGFGTGIVPKSWGFTLQNRGHCFSLEPDHPNALGPGKRPYHTIIPALITQPNISRKEELFACFGVMGGYMQPQGHLQVAMGLIDDHFDPQTALDQPRFCIADGESGGSVALEEGISFRTAASLAEMGHTITPTSGTGRAIFGRGQVILRDPAFGVLIGGSDSRADGCAMVI